MAIHTSTAPARAGERARSPKSQIGPVTQALRVMLAADPDQPRIRELRRSIADRIEADIALLDALDPFADEREADYASYAADGLTIVGYESCAEGTDDHGIADFDGMMEQSIARDSLVAL